MSFTFHSAHSADWPAVLDSSVETEAEVSRDVARWAMWTEDNEDRCQISRDFQCTKTERDKIMKQKTQNNVFQLKLLKDSISALYALCIGPALGSMQ